MAVEPEGGGGPVGHIIRAIPTEYLLKMRERDNSSKPNRIRAKGSPPEKNTTSKKELLTLRNFDNVAEGRC